jgi:hypothetical protein
MMSGFHKPVNWQTRAANARGKCGKAAQVFSCKLLEHQSEGWGWLSMLR